MWRGESWCDENWHGWMLDAFFLKLLALCGVVWRC